MPTLPLYDAGSPPDASHHVTAPGGYEWWYFDAYDSAADLRLIAILYCGYPFHPRYLRQYKAYLRHPMRNRPPVPMDYTCVEFAVYEKGMAGRFMTHLPPERFQASGQITDVTIGDNRVRRSDDGNLLISFRGRASDISRSELSAELQFTPRFMHRPYEQAWQMHKWIIADPLCDVQGDIHMRGRTIRMNAKGYHDHHYGSRPIALDVRRWMRGRVLGDNSTLSFDITNPVDTTLKDAVHVCESTSDCTRELEAEMFALEDWRYTRHGLRYPAILRLPGASFTRPRLIHRAPFDLGLIYEQSKGSGAPALCEIMYPARLSWPFAGRLTAPVIRYET